MLNIFITSRILCNKFRATQKIENPKFSYRIILPSKTNKKKKTSKSTTHCKTVKRIKKENKILFSTQ